MRPPRRLTIRGWGQTLTIVSDRGINVGGRRGYSLRAHWRRGAGYLGGWSAFVVVNYSGHWAYRNAAGWHMRLGRSEAARRVAFGITRSGNRQPMISH
jgi:hypothetical protein